MNRRRTDTGYCPVSYSKPCALWYGIITTLVLLALVAALALEW